MMSFKYTITLFIALIFLGCSEPPQESVSSDEHKSTVESGVMDKIGTINIRPLNASVTSVITLQSSDASLNRSKIRWYVNEIEDELSRGVRFSSNDLKKGDVVKAVIIQGKKELVSNEISIRNTPPLIHKARIYPTRPVASSNIIVEASAEDADGDYISFKYNWTHNGNFAGEDSSLEKEVKRGDVISVTVTPVDNEGAGNSVTLESSIVNSLPEITEGPHQFNGTLYKYQISAADPDGDDLSYTLEEGPEGMNVDPSSGIITWEAGPADAGIYDFKVSVSDNHGGKILVPLTTVISAQ